MGSDPEKGAEYTIVVRGELDPRFAYLFGEMQMEQISGSTVLKGSVIDQAQLHGFIERCEELGLELLTVERTEALANQDEREGNA